MITENVSTLKIHKLSQEQYDREANSGNLDAHALYMTPKNNNVSHVGMIIHSTTLDTMEKVIEIYGGTAWEKIEGMFLLGQSSAYAVNSTGGEAKHALTTAEMPGHTHTGPSHYHTVGQHNHGLNGHTHSIPALSGTAASNGGHSHNIYYRSITGPQSATSGGYYAIGSSSTNTGTTGAVVTIGAHTHNVTTTASTTGASTGSTANSTSFNSGNAGTGATGSTGSNGEHNNMPPYKTVYIWERVA